MARRSSKRNPTSPAGGAANSTSGTQAGTTGAAGVTASGASSPAAASASPASGAATTPAGMASTTLSAATVPTSNGGRAAALPTLADLTATITPRNAALATVVVLAVALLFWFGWRFRYVALAIVAGIFLHIAIKPAIDALQRRGVNRRLGVTIVYSVLFLAVAGLIGALVPMITGQVGAFTEELPGLYRNVRNFLLSSEIDLLPRLGRLLPPSWDLQRLSQIVVNSVDTGGAQPSPLLLLSQTGTVLFYLLAIFGLGYYLTLDRERVVGGLLTRLPAARRAGVRSFVDEVETSVGQFVRGQVILSGVVGVASLIVYWLIGLPYALALGVIAAVLEAVPMIGPVLTAIPAAILAAAIGPQQVLYVLVALALIQTVESNVLVPRIMDKAVGVSPLVSILALTFFGLLFGLPGAILAIPLAAVIQLVLNRTVFREPAPMAESPLAAPVNLAVIEHPAVSGRSRLDRLRLQASELAQDVRKHLRSTPSGDNSAVSDEAAELEDLIEVTAGALFTLLTEAQQAEVQAVQAVLAEQQATAAQPSAPAQSTEHPDDSTLPNPQRLLVVESAPVGAGPSPTLVDGKRTPGNRPSNGQRTPEEQL